MDWHTCTVGGERRLGVQAGRRKRKRKAIEPKRGGDSECHHLAGHHLPPLPSPLPVAVAVKRGPPPSFQMQQGKEGRSYKSLAFGSVAVTNGSASMRRDQWWSLVPAAWYGRCVIFGNEKWRNGGDCLPQGHVRWRIAEPEPPTQLNRPTPWKASSSSDGKWVLCWWRDRFVNKKIIIRFVYK